MSFVVDSNVLVAAYNRESPHHERARPRLEAWLADRPSWYVSWPILYEFVRVTTHPAVFRAPATLDEAWGFVSGLLDSGRVRLLRNTDRHAAVARELVDECPWVSGSILHDFHTAALMREHGIKEIRTADTDFLKFRFLRVVNPLRE